MVVVRSEHSFLHVGQLHEHLVVLAAEVKLGEEMGAMELVEEFIHHGNGKHVADHLAIESTIVHTETPQPILHLDKQYRRRVGRCARADDALHEHVLTLPLQFILHKLWVQKGRTAIGAVPGWRWMRWLNQRGSGSPMGIVKTSSKSWSRVDIRSVEASACTAAAAPGAATPCQSTQ
jgi:hypothetical protein